MYPFLGPARTPQDVEQARAALEKAYRDKGYQSVTVEVPTQTGRNGVVLMQVTEAPVGRLRVLGSRYYDLQKIKQHVPSLAPGTVPEFSQVTREIVSLNQWADRRVTPELRAGVKPGTVDIDLNVKDTLPLHGSVELNNRYTADTTPLRLSVSANYANLWQLGHGLGLSYQVAPLRPDDAEVFAANYLLRIPSVDWMTVVLQGIKQTSNITSQNVGSINVNSPGETLGVRLNITLPPGHNFSESLTLGWDYKHYEERQTIAGEISSKPLSYYPASIGYEGIWSGPGYLTDFNLGVVFAYRGLGSRPASFDRKRINADANFIYLHGDVSHQHDLPGGTQLYGRIHGQLADQPLVNTEQIGGGGLDTVRGYLESETLADNGIFGTLELRSPSLFRGSWAKGHEWRAYAFGDAGYLTLREALPEQDSAFSLASVGVGTRLNLFDHFQGSLDVALPLLDQSPTQTGDWRLTFRLWADF